MKRPAAGPMFGRPSKRIKLSMAQAECLAWSWALATARQEEHLPAWWTTNDHSNSSSTSAMRAQKGGGQQLMLQAEVSISLDWALQPQQVSASVSLAQRSSGDGAIGGEDIADTANSSSSDTSCPQQAAAGDCRRQHTCAATGEEDSITSNHPSWLPGPGFSFGDRPVVSPDVAGIQHWVVLHRLAPL